MAKSMSCLKFIFIFLSFILYPSAFSLLYAGAPLKINFQGRLEESGKPAEGAKNFTFGIYGSPAGGSAEWTSQAASVAVANGVFSVVLETGTPANLSTATFTGARYVEITVDGVPLSPRQEMVSAPYALVAQALAPNAVISLSNLEKDPSLASVINTSTNAVDWTQLKNVPSGLADGIDEGGVPTFSTAAIVSGKFSDERVSISTGAIYGGFNGPDLLVQLDGTGKLQALDGSALTNVNSAPMSALTAQVNDVAASTGTLTVNLAAVALSTGSIASRVNNVAASTGTLTVNLATVALSTGSIAAQVNSVAASTGTLTVNLASVALSTGNIAAQVNNVAASTGTLTVNLAAVVLSTGPLANSGTWSGSISVGGAITLPIVKISGAGYNSGLTAYPLGAGHRTVVADTADDDIYVSLPDAASVEGRIYSIKNFDRGAVGNMTYVTTFAGQTIDDNQISGPPFELNGQFDSVTLQSDGFNWIIID